jgi:putative NIF3 family GTP cyclohydrolase 1 type 2
MLAIHLAVAVVAGGGADVWVLEELPGEEVNTLVTGTTTRNARTEDAHRFAEKHRISILGGTHYSTEKPACQAMCGYFRNLGLACEFIDDQPVLEDL